MVLKELAQPSVANAKSFIESAEILIEKGKYGHAMSMAILSQEESSKALMCCSRKYSKKNLENKVRRHPDKLKFIGQVFHATVLFYMVCRETPIKNEEELKNRIKELMGSFDMLDFNNDAGSFDAKFVKHCPVKKEANDFFLKKRVMREKGFYVGINNGKVITPELITKEQAKKEVELSKFIYHMVWSMVTKD
jgi:AbiV family abortive infection protein